MKVYVIVRSDLEMTCGKMISQAIHAFDRLVDKVPISKLLMWRLRGEKIIVLKSGKLEDMVETLERASILGIHSNVFRDAGHTQVEPGTITAIAFGPINPDEKDKSDLFNGYSLL